MESYRCRDRRIAGWTIQEIIRMNDDRGRIRTATKTFSARSDRFSACGPESRLHVLQHRPNREDLGGPRGLRTGCWESREALATIRRLAEKIRDPDARKAI